MRTPADGRRRSRTLRRRRGRRRPRPHPARRPRAADRRERPELRAHPARRGPRARLQGAGRARAARARAGAGARRTSRDAITLDIRLPDIDGWRVLDRLKHDPAHAPHPGARHLDRRRAASAALALGAHGVLAKPIRPRDRSTRRSPRSARARRTRATRELLLVDGRRRSAAQLAQLARRPTDVDGRAVGTAAEALAALHASRFDCVVRRPRAAGRSRRSSCVERARSRNRAAAGRRLRARTAPEQATVAPARLARTARRAQQIRSATAARRGARCSCTAVSPMLPDAQRRLLRASCTRRRRRSPGEGADRRRRHPQHLRADERARAARHGTCCRPRTAATRSSMLAEHARTSTSC